MIDRIKYWCHKILPLTYDDSLSYYEVLCKLTNKINEVITWVNDNLAEYIREQIGDIFIDTTYDSATETLDFSLDDEGGEGTSGNIANISVNGYTRPVKDATARGDISSLSTLVNQLGDNVTAITNTLNEVAGVGQSNLLIVAKSNARFNTINDAIDYASEYCSLNNRVTIAIVGGAGTIYAESIDLDNNPGIDFLGISQPIVRSSVAWRYSTLRCSNTITVEGITFENYYTPGEGEYAGYGLHADPVVGIQIYRNCTFYSDHNQGAGIGTNQNGQLNFDNCEFIGTNAVYFHNRAEGNKINQWIRFYNCKFRSFGTAPAIRVLDAAYATNTSWSSQLGVVFANCVAYPNRGVQYLYDGSHSVTYIPSTGRTVSSAPSTNIFLVSSSSSPNIPGVDYNNNAKRMFYRWYNSGTATYLELKDAVNYTFNVIQARISTDKGNTFTDVTSTASIALSADATYPDQIRCIWANPSLGDVYELNVACFAK